MTGLSAQLNYIRENYPQLETIWMVSDKCNNFNSFDQIPFLVSGNERNWNNSAETKKTFKVAKWIVTEAQCGKDALDCHFSWVRCCFLCHLCRPGALLTQPRNMYEALTHKTLQITNTHILLGDVKHAPVDKCTLPALKLKVQSVHVYEYTTLEQGGQEVEIGYHGDIKTPSTRYKFTTKQKVFTEWIKRTEFAPTQWKKNDTFKCIKLKDKGEKGSRSSNDTDTATSTLCMAIKNESDYHKKIVEYAFDWMKQGFSTQMKQEEVAFQKPESAATRRVKVDTNGWAKKSSPPAVTLPLPIKKELTKLFNRRNPFVSPEEGVNIIREIEEYRNDAFVWYFVTGVRIKAFFGRLTAYKKKHRLARDVDVPEEAAGGQSKTNMNKSFNGMRSKSDLQCAVNALNLPHYKGLASKSIPELVQILTEAAADPDAEDDMDLTNAIAETSELLGDDGTSYFGTNNSDYYGMHVVDDAEDDEEEDTMLGTMENVDVVTQDIIVEEERCTSKQKRKSVQKDACVSIKRRRRNK
jgi:hypothetical protein